MSDLWIVSAYKYTPHYSLEVAEMERDRLATLHGQKKFRVYRIKGTVRPSQSKAIIEAETNRANEAKALLLRAYEAFVFEVSHDDETIAEIRAFLDGKAKLDEALK